MNSFFLFLIFLFFVGKYYQRVMKRFLSQFFQIQAKKWNLSIAFFSYFLSFSTLNVFSSLGIFLLHFLVFSLFFEILFWGYQKIRKLPSFLSVLFRSSFFPFLLTIVFFLYGFFNIRTIVETKYEIQTDKNISSSLRILFLSDTHYGTVLHKDDLERFKNSVKDKDVDILLLGGDIVDENTTKEEMQEIFAILGSIPSKYGSYFVYGNHDRQKYSKTKLFQVEELEATLTQNNIVILSDEVVSLREDILLVGREDVSATRLKNAQLLHNISDSQYVILVDHQPVDLKENASLGVDLMLSGHTHAGQIFPAGYFIKWFHMADLWYGKEKFDSMYGIVSSGLAGWGYPIRTQEHSEYVLIDILK